MSITDIFENFKIDAETVSAIINDDTSPVIAAIFGVDERLIIAFSKILPVFASGETDIRSLIAAIVPAALSYLVSLKIGGDETEKKTAPEDVSESDRDEDIKNLKDFDEFFRAEEDKKHSPVDYYLQNSSPS